MYTAADTGETYYAVQQRLAHVATGGWRVYGDHRCYLAAADTGAGAQQQRQQQHQVQEGNGFDVDMSESTGCGDGDSADGFVALKMKFTDPYAWDENHVSVTKSLKTWNADPSRPQTNRLLSPILVSYAGYDGLVSGRVASPTHD
ncbi:hypothetical protein HK104_001237 [Borealophlyctis nickersoniae]|nr:hypothetical protein HK104_001237 [Borealophlyctis nickersoniae]